MNGDKNGFLEDVFFALKEAFRAARHQRTMFLSAGLAYFVVFSLVPAVLAMAAVASLVWGEGASAQELVRAITHWVGPEPARYLDYVLDTARPPGTAGAMGLVVVLLAASVVFYHLRRILNVAWGVSPRRGVRHLLAGRWLAFLTVLLMGGAMALALGAHAALATIQRFLPESIGHQVWTGLYEAILYVGLAGLIACLLKFLPAAAPRWGEVLTGAALTAALLTGVNHLLGMYFSRQALPGFYGAGAGIEIVLLWIYLSAQVFLFGATFTGLYAVRRGWRPDGMILQQEETHAQEKT